MGDNRGLGVVVAVVLAVAVGTGGGGEVAGPAFPPGVVELLPHAVLLREVGAVEFPYPHGAVLLGVQDLNGDGFPDLVVAGDRRVQVWFGDKMGRFSPGPWVYLEVEEYREGVRIPGRTVGKSDNMQLIPYELEVRKSKAFAPSMSL